MLKALALFGRVPYCLGFPSSWKLTFSKSNSKMPFLSTLHGNDYKKNDNFLGNKRLTHSERIEQQILKQDEKLTEDTTSIEETTQIPYENLFNYQPSNDKNYTIRTRFDCQGLLPHQQLFNAKKFMQMLEHVCLKEHSTEIVRKIEKISSSIKANEEQQSKALSQLTKKKWAAKRSKEVQEFFKEMRSFLYSKFQQLNNDPQADLQCTTMLLELLSKAKHDQITVESLQNNYYKDDKIQQSTQILTSELTSMLYQENFIPNHLQKSHQLILPSSEYVDHSPKPFDSKSKLLVKNPVQNPPKLEHLNVAEDKVVFQKVKRDSQENQHKILESQLFLYVYELPYDISSKQVDQFLEFLYSRNINVKGEYLLMPYKNYLERNQNEILYRIPDDLLRKRFDQVRIEKIILNPKTNQTFKNHKKISFEETREHPLEIIRPQRKSLTDPLLQKIKKQTYSKFNKSSMLLKFQTIEDKESFLQNEFRLYGLNYRNFKNIKFEEGYSKTIISVTNVPWGCVSSDLLEVINKSLKKHGMKIMYDQCILTKEFLFIQLDCLVEAVEAMIQINNIVFQKQKLKAQLSYGPCKIHHHLYKKGIEFDHYETLKKKIEDSNSFYSQFHKQKDQI